MSSKKVDWPACRAAGIDPYRKPTLLTQQKKYPTIKRKDEKRFVSITMIKTAPLPDGTEKYLKTTLYAGITYSIPASVAEILLKEGLARKADSLKK